MLEWSTDEDFWVRRIAIDHQLCRKERTNTELLEKILVNNFGSSEFFINKAIGWSLRDYSKTNQVGSFGLVYNLYVPHMVITKGFDLSFRSTVELFR